jgi:hypothetical protein
MLQENEIEKDLFQLIMKERNEEFTNFANSISFYTSAHSVSRLRLSEKTGLPSFAYVLRP